VQQNIGLKEPACIRWITESITNVFNRLLWELHEMDEVHPIILQIHVLFIFNNEISKVTWCFMIILQGYESIHIEMERE